MRTSKPPAIPAVHVVIAPQSQYEQRRFPDAVAPRATIATERVAQIPAHPDYDLKYRGGKLIPNLTFTNLYVGGTSAWKQSDITSIDQALAAAMNDRRLNNVMQQYFTSPITSTFRPSTILDGAAAASIAQSDAEQMLTTLYQGGKLGGYDYANTVFNLMLPSGIVLTDTSSGAGSSTGGEGGDRETKASSLQGLGGYHGEVAVGGTTLYYAIGAYSETRSDGSQNGVVAFPDPWKNVVATFYHELNEARTDADVNGTPGWVSDPIADLGSQSVECGDAPVYEAGNNLSLVFQEAPLADGSGTVPVQFMWSNAVHGPEGPLAAPHPTAAGTAGGVGIAATVLGVLGILAVVGVDLVAGVTSTTKTPLFIGDIASGVLALIAAVLNLIALGSTGLGQRIALGLSVLALIGAAIFLFAGGVMG